MADVFKYLRHLASALGYRFCQLVKEYEATAHSGQAHKEAYQRRGLYKPRLQHIGDATQHHNGNRHQHQSVRQVLLALSVEIAQRDEECHKQFGITAARNNGHLDVQPLHPKQEHEGHQCHHAYELHTSQTGQQQAGHLARTEEGEHTDQHRAEEPIQLAERAVVAAHSEDDGPHPLGGFGKGVVGTRTLGCGWLGTNHTYPGKEIVGNQKEQAESQEGHIDSPKLAFDVGPLVVKIDFLELQSLIEKH